MRGGAVPNYDPVAVAEAEAALAASKLPMNIVVDCSHANSRKNHAYTELVGLFAGILPEILADSQATVANVGTYFNVPCNPSSQCMPGSQP